MQVLIGPALTLEEQSWDDGRAATIGLGGASAEAQLMLGEIHAYLEICRANLKELRKELAFLETGPDNATNCRKAAERLDAFCVDADGWGSASLYEAGWSVQLLLLNSIGRIQSGNIREALNRGLDMLSVLIEQCENDYRRHLAVADTLDFISQTIRSHSS